MPDQPSYVAYYGLKVDPFSSEVVDPPFVAVAGRQKAVDTLLHLLNYSDEVIFIAGLPGSGKTTLLEQLIRQMGENIDLLITDVAEITSDKELLWDLATQFNLQPDRSHSTERLQHMLQSHCQSLHEQGQIPTLAIDDIDELPVETLGGLAPILHGGIAGEPGLRLVGLASQPAEVRRELSALGFATGQMIELPAFSLDDSVNLIQAYFNYAGLSAGVPLEPATLKRLYKLSAGRPGAFVDAVRDHMLVEAQRRRRKNIVPVPHLVAGAAVIAVIALAALYQSGDESPSEIDITPVPDTAELSAQESDASAATPAESEVEPESAEAVRARLEAALADRAEGVASPPEDVIQPGPDTTSGAEIPADLLADLTEESGPESAPAPETPTPAPQPPAEPDEDRSPLRSPDWITGGAPDRYTLQLLGAREESNILQFAEGNNLSPDNAGYMVTELEGQPWYVLLYGTYEDAESARSAISELPEAAQSLSPWPRSLGSVQ